MRKLKADLFLHAISDLEFSTLESESIKKEHIDNLLALGNSSFFKMNDFLTLLSRMDKYFKDLENGMIEQINNNNQQLAKTINNRFLLEEINKKNKTDILNVKDSIESQLDTIGLGVLLRVHAFLEEVLKRLCQTIKEIFSIETKYENMKREGRFSGDNISTFEKCVIYIDKSPLNTKVDLYRYDFLFEWNKVRNILVHDGGEVSKEKANEYRKKLGLHAFKGYSQKIVFNADKSLKENRIIEKPLKIKLSIPDIVNYILNIDMFLADLVNLNGIHSYNQSQKIKTSALSELANGEKFKEVFSSAFEQIKNNKNIAEMIGISKMDEEYEEYLMGSLKLLLNDIQR
ncbi:hypothetical protein COM77_23420 [Bacillus cereus]|uniref:hypothetical protein n=1 Tax=Bacillus cereus TaxID=1396 RepID=UPI000BEE7A10|nr:hypothetical protein [Bacillus cereus]MDA1935437.1 hypothetical protein [Bacillus cereus]MDA1941342.1 hypothetical protein [Bacillus cereus]PEB33867.1 hypothetical protein COM77_23420 [Bacillus cereus]TKH24112.1 hypothetical protein FC692_21835 [Bacillus cereus]